MLRIPVGNCQRALPAEIATGGTPAWEIATGGTPGLWEIRNRAAAFRNSPVGII